MNSEFPHISVLLTEVVEALKPRQGGVYLDGTFGAGGYSRGLLEAADCMIWGIDCDPLSQKYARSLSQTFPGKIKVLNGRYGDMIRLLRSFGVSHLDGIALDLGVSSMQLDEPSRGFSFQSDGPLDMRMSNQGRSAADVVNKSAEGVLSDIIYRYGEERASRKVAKEIVRQRAKQPITRTTQLADMIRRVVVKSRDGLDPATRTFQALRIYVNGELDDLERGLNAAEQLLLPGGRLAVVSFHSLEDRKIKSLLKSRSEIRSRPSRHLPERLEDNYPSTFRIIERGGIKPSQKEIAKNPRARSARLRIAERTSVLTKFVA